MNSKTLKSPEERAETLVQKSQGVINAMLHVADVGNAVKPWTLCFEYANRVLDEFFLQGDREKELGMPVQMLCDRETVNRANAQIGFCEFMMTPLVMAFTTVLPDTYEFSQNLADNLQNW